MNIVFKSVNWMQGMSVSSSHFIATENYLMERMMKTSEALQNKFAYGLFPQTDGAQMQLTIEGKGDGSKLVLGSYHGITKGGCLVDITPSQPVFCECDSSIDVAEYGWDVVLSVSPFERHPCGEPNMQETPPRYPFVEPIYKLGIIERDKEKVNEYGPYDVVVSLLKKKDGEYKLDADYIAPSLTMSADTRLMRLVEKLSHSLSSMKCSMEIINEKAYSCGTNRTKCLDNTLLFCREIQRSIANMDYKWRNLELTMSPYQVSEIFGEIANSALLSFSFMSKSDKDEMLKYFYEWNGVMPSAFEQVLGDVACRQYRQNRISDAMLSIESLLKILEELLVSLSKLDYVGQRKESMVISVSSANEESGQSKKSSWLL